MKRLKFREAHWPVWGPIKSSSGLSTRTWFVLVLWDESPFMDTSFSCASYIVTYMVCHNISAFDPRFLRGIISSCWMVWCLLCLFLVLISQEGSQLLPSTQGMTSLSVHVFLRPALSWPLSWTQALPALVPGKSIVFLYSEGLPHPQTPACWELYS